MWVYSLLQAANQAGWRVNKSSFSFVSTLGRSDSWFQTLHATCGDKKRMGPAELNKENGRNRGALEPWSQWSIYLLSFPLWCSVWRSEALWCSSAGESTDTDSQTDVKKTWTVDKHRCPPQHPWAAPSWANPFSQTTVRHEEQKAHWCPSLTHNNNTNKLTRMSVQLWRRAH